MKHNSEFFEMQSREIDQDGPFALMVLEADDTLRTVRDMPMEERKKNLPDIEEALAFLSAAAKECQ